MTGLLSKTTVVPVATGVRLGIDTSCVSCGAQAPGNVDLLEQVGKGKSPGTDASRYQGSLIDWHRAGADLASCEVVAATATTGEREA